MNKYEESLKELRKKIRENEELSRVEWDNYAHENELFSSTTLIAGMEVKAKEDFFSYGNFMGESYSISYKHLKNLNIDLGGFPTVKTWNEYAKKNSCLSAQSMEYISRI